MSSINLYDILDVKETATTKEVKKAYRELVKKHHPDRGGDPEHFELISHAFNILKNEQERAKYDKEMELSNKASKNFVDLKFGAKDYFEKMKQEPQITDEEKERMFTGEMSKMDNKHGFNREEVDLKLDSKKANRLVDDLMLSREQEEIEFQQEPIFNPNERMDPSKFNALFERLHRTQGMEMVEHQGNPDPFESGDIEFTGIDHFDQVYEDDTGEYANINIDTRNHQKISKKDLEKLDGVDYYDGHDKDKKDDNYKQELENKMNEMKMNRDELLNLDFNEFNTDVDMGGYGMTDKLGIEFQTHEWEDDDDLREKYTRYLEFKNEELKQEQDEIRNELKKIKDKKNKEKKNKDRKNKDNKTFGGVTKIKKKRGDGFEE